MFQTPLRALGSLRPNVPPVILAASSVSTVVFTATPFLVTELSEQHGVSTGRVGLISSLQLAGFVLASWGAGRVLRPRRRLMVIAVIIGMIANLVSGFVDFEVLLAVRFVNGIALGAIAWLAWAEVFGDDERIGDIAVIGPIVGTVMSPIVGTFGDRFGPDHLFMALSALHVLPLIFVSSSRLSSPDRVQRTRHRPSRSAVIAMTALGLMTLGGSGVFVFANSIGRGPVGMSAFTVSLLFSVNSIAGIPSSRYRGERTNAALWVACTGISAFLIAVVHHPLAFVAGMALWGFSFWMAVPAAFSVLAANSNYPAERAGDAQAYMALGRVIGPMVGGLLYDVDPWALGLAGSGVIFVSAITLGILGRQRRVRRFAAATP
jgi:MFS family permease